jgi:hypothetical protein
VKAGGAGGRSVVARSLQRPDGPAEIFGYWLANHGRNLAMPLERGVADAVRRLYTGRAVMRHDGLSRQLRMPDPASCGCPIPPAADGRSRQLRMADVIELAHAAPLGVGLVTPLTIGHPVQGAVNPYSAEVPALGR